MSPKAQTLRRPAFATRRQVSSVKRMKVGKRYGYLSSLDVLSKLVCWAPSE